MKIGRTNHGGVGVYVGFLRIRQAPNTRRNRLRRKNFIKRTQPMVCCGAKSQACRLNRRLRCMSGIYVRDPKSMGVTHIIIVIITIAVFHDYNCGHCMRPQLFAKMGKPERMTSHVCTRIYAKMGKPERLFHPEGLARVKTSTTRITPKHAPRGIESSRSVS